MPRQAHLSREWWECPFQCKRTGNLVIWVVGKVGLAQLCPSAEKSCCKVYYAHNPDDSGTSLIALKGAIPLFLVHSPQQPDNLLAFARRLLSMCTELLLATNNVEGSVHSPVSMLDSCAYKVVFASFGAQCRPNVISCPGHASVLQARMFDQSHLAAHLGV